jgi:hypothetical protein
MTTRKSSEKEIKIKLIEDAKDPNAWENPINVPASRAPRPERLDAQIEANEKDDD